MLRKLLVAVMSLLLWSTLAWAAVDANTATKDELDALKGVGPAIAQRIVDERQKNGPFKSLDDLQERVKGVGPATIKKLAAEGLTVGGSSAMPAATKAKAPAEKASAAADKTASTKTASKSSKAATSDKAAASEPASAASGAKGRKKKEKAEAKAG
jgi:competence protein ComEA